MRFGLATRFVLAAAAWLLAAAVLLGGWVLPAIQERLARQDAASLRDMARVLGEQAPEFWSTSRSAALAQDLGVDLAVLDAAGRKLHLVWAKAPDASWPRLSALTLEQARQTGYAARLRQNARGERRLTIAYRLARSPSASGTQPAFVCLRRAAPVAPLPLTPWMSGAAVLLAVGVLWWSWRTGDRLARSAKMLTNATRAIESGDFAAPIDVQRDDEIGRLAESLTAMSRDAGGRLEEARRVGDQMAAVLQGMQDAVVAVNARREVLFANPAAERLFGAAQPMRDRRLAELVRNRALHEAVDAFFASGDAHRIELQWGEEQRAFSVVLTGLPGPGRSGVILSFHDLTELRRLESLRQEFVANVSHELKTPLSSIKAYAETLRDGAMEDAEHRHRFLARIEEQADRLHELILDLISLARIESGQESFEIVTLSLPRAVRRCVAGHQEACQRKQIRLEAALETSPNVSVLADEEGLRQILDNLIHNAVKYTPPEGRIEVRWSLGDEHPGQVEVEVADSGCGIPQEALPRVFERFFRVDQARARSLGGTGLGLAIVKHLVGAFGGSVSVSSELGQGSVFRFRLPLARQDGKTL